MDASQDPTLLAVLIARLRALASLGASVLSPLRQHGSDGAEDVELVNLRDGAPHSACPLPRRMVGGGRWRKEPGVPFADEASRPECGGLGVGTDPGMAESPSSEGGMSEIGGAGSAGRSGGCGSEGCASERGVDPERAYFSNLVNRKLMGDPALVGVLPLDPESDDLIGASRDGVLPCKLLGKMLPDAIDERAVNLAPAGATLEERLVMENHALCLSSVAALGAVVADLEPEELMAPDSRAVMALLWIIVREGMLQGLDVRKTPELGVLLQDDEQLVDLLQLSAEDLLLRWANFALEQVEVNSERGEAVPRVADFGESLRDCQAYLWLLHRAAPHLCDPVDFKTKTALERARAVLECCEKLGIGSSHTPEDLCSGNEHVGMALVAEIFQLHHGLAVADLSTDMLADEDELWDEGSREERVFRMWLNSLGCRAFCGDLFSEDVQRGWLLLEVLDSMVPGTVDWDQAFQPPFKDVVHRIKSASNCNQVVRIAREKLSLSLVGIGGEDIADGKHKPILALVWQLMRWHTLQVIRSAANGGHGTSGASGEGLNEADVLEWANQLLSLKGSKHRISSFRDPRLASGLPLLDLLTAIEPGCVQEQHSAPGTTPEEKKLNAKYVISMTRKLGGTVLVAWEDIAEVRPKMMLILIASLMQLDKRRRQRHRMANLQKGAALCLGELRAMVGERAVEGQ